MQASSIITLNNYSFDSRYCVGQGSFGKVYKGTSSLYNQEEISKLKKLLPSNKLIDC
jgi:hypothetical protein